MLKPKRDGKKIFSFDEDSTYIEEGQFRDDILDGTFGRRFKYTGAYQIGWFSGGDLHGYGREVKLVEERNLKLEGLFEKG